MISRRQFAFVHSAVTIVAAAVMLPPAVAATTNQPPSVLFRHGYNLCRAASLSSIRRAGNEHYKAGTFTNDVCTWERSDLKAGVALSTHPTKVGRALMRMFKAQSGKQHVVARTIRIPQANRALLVTLPAGASTQRAKYLFAAYRRGVIQVNMTAPKSVSAERIKAVLGAVVGR